MKRTSIISGWALVLSALIIGGCTGFGLGQTSDEDAPTDPIGLANPASVFCEQRGYTLEMRTDGDGTYGVCIFPDGSECEEWAYYRGECEPTSEQAVEPTAEQVIEPPVEPTAEPPPEPADQPPPQDAPSQPTAAPPPAGCVDDSDFVADLTIPDGNMLAPGASFVKSWRMRNSGTCTWTPQYQFYDIYSGTPGTRISASQSISIPRNVAPGETIDLSVTMTAPTVEGEYTSRWRMASPGGGAFGSQPYVNIVVREPVAACTDDSEFVADLTVPDGTQVGPGEVFIKTWQLRNNGTCTWTPQYQFYDIHSGSPVTRISAPQSIAIPREVAPGETIDLSVTMTAPSVEGEYTSRWRMADAGGGPFGVQPYVTIAIGETGRDCVDDAEFETDVTVPDGTEFESGETFTKTWRMRNSGTCPWTPQYWFYDQFYGSPGTRIEGPESIVIPHDVAPGETIDLSVEMTAPDEAGEYTSRWWMANPGGGAFGSQPYVNIVVKE
jgi:putative hemolysin